MLHTNNEIDRAYYFTILRTPWGEQMEDGLLCNSMSEVWIEQLCWRSC